MMDDEVERFIGMWVQVWDIDNKYLGLGTITKLETVKVFGIMFDGFPTIRLTNGRELFGAECWWKPYNEAEI